MHGIGGALRVRNSCSPGYRYKDKRRFNGIFAPASVIKKLCILSGTLRLYFYSAFYLSVSREEFKFLGLSLNILHCISLYLVPYHV